MKKVFLIIILALILVGCSNNEEKTNQEKIMEEISYLDKKIVSMLNELNKIMLQNYQITSKEIEKNKKEDNSQGANSKEENLQTQSNSQQQNTKEENSQAQSDSQQQNTKENTVKISELTHESILNSSQQEIEWDKLKTDIELINTSWKILLLDLYKIEKVSDNTNNFSNSLNNCIIAIKNEDKIASIITLSDLYNFLPQILNEISAEKSEINIKQTKSHILYAYSFANQNNWGKVKEEILYAEEEFLKVMGDIEFTKNKENKISSVYVGIKELEKSLNKEDIQIFFMNYKILIEKINIL